MDLITSILASVKWLPGRTSHRSIRGHSLPLGWPRISLTVARLPSPTHCGGAVSHQGQPDTCLQALLHFKAASLHGPWHHPLVSHRLHIWPPDALATGADSCLPWGYHRSLPTILLTWGWHKCNGHPPTHPHRAGVTARKSARPRLLSFRSGCFGPQHRISPPPGGFQLSEVLPVAFAGHIMDEAMDMVVPPGMPPLVDSLLKVRLTPLPLFNPILVVCRLSASGNMPWVVRTSLAAVNIQSVDSGCPDQWLCPRVFGEMPVCHAAPATTKVLRKEVNSLLEKRTIKEIHCSSLLEVLLPRFCSAQAKWKTPESDQPSPPEQVSPLSPLSDGDALLDCWHGRQSACDMYTLHSYNQDKTGWGGSSDW